MGTLEDVELPEGMTAPSGALVVEVAQPGGAPLVYGFVKAEPVPGEPGVWRWDDGNRVHHSNGQPEDGDEPGTWTWVEGDARHVLRPPMPLEQIELGGAAPAE